MNKAILIIVILMLARPVMPVVNYIANYKYIVAELCENREKPEMHCNGKCHLKKELAKASENEKPLSSKKSGIQESEVIYFLQADDYQLSSVIFAISGKNAIAYTNLYSYTLYTSFFHPPAVV